MSAAIIGSIAAAIFILTYAVGYRHGYGDREADAWRTWARGSKGERQ